MKDKPTKAQRRALTTLKRAGWTCIKGRNVAIVPKGCRLIVTGAAGTIDAANIHGAVEFERVGSLAMYDRNGTCNSRGWNVPLTLTPAANTETVESSPNH